MASQNTQADNAHRPSSQEPPEQEKHQPAQRRRLSSLQSRFPLLVLPSIVLIILSFAFSIVALTSNGWVHTPVYQFAGNATITAAWARRGPFRHCAVDDSGIGNPSITVFPTHCENSPLCDENSQYNDMPYQCQQMGLWSNLLLAGAVLVAISMAMAIILGAVLFGAGRWSYRNQQQQQMQASNHADSQEQSTNHPRPRRREYYGRLHLEDLQWSLSYATIAFLNLSILFTAVSSLSLLQLLTNDVYPSGIDTSEPNLQGNNFDHWTWKQPGVTYAFLSWFPSVIGVLLLIPTAFGTCGRRHGYQAVAGDED